MDLITLGVQLLNAVQYGAVLFLVASGLTLVFGILGVINLAHGAFYMLGAYLAYWITLMTGSFVVALLGGVLVAFIAGILLETVFVRLLYGRDHLAQVLLSFGLILVIDEIRQLLFGKDVHAVAPPAWLSGSIQLTDNPVLSGLPAGDLCVLPDGGTRHLLRDHAHQNRHDRAGGLGKS